MGIRPASIRIPLYCLGTFLGFLVIILSGTPLTSSVTFSILLLMMNAVSAKSRKSYARKRLLGQAIGLICGWVPYMLLSFLPYGAQVCISMTIGVAAALSINAWLKLGIGELLLCTPVFLISLNLPGRGVGYPLWRMGYVALGIAIGYIIVLFINPPNYQEAYLKQARQLGKLLESEPEHLLNGKALSKAKTLFQAAETELGHLRDDISPFRKHHSREVLERSSSVMRTSAFLLQALEQYQEIAGSLSESFRPEFVKEATRLMANHALLLSDDERTFDARSVWLIELKAEMPMEILASAGLIRYCHYVSNDPVLAAVPSAAPGQEPLTEVQ